MDLGNDIAKVQGILTPGLTAGDQEITFRHGGGLTNRARCVCTGGNVDVARFLPQSACLPTFGLSIEECSQ